MSLLIFSCGIARKKTKINFLVSAKTNLTSLLEKNKLINRFFFLVSLNYRTVQDLTALQLEMAFRLQLLEKRLKDAVIKIQSVFRGCMIRATVG